MSRLSEQRLIYTRSFSPKDFIALSLEMGQPALFAPKKGEDTLLTCALLSSYKAFISLLIFYKLLKSKLPANVYPPVKP